MPRAEIGFPETQLSQQVQQDLPRYQLIKKEHDKEVYLDRQTGKKVKVERKD